LEDYTVETSGDPFENGGSPDPFETDGSSDLEPSTGDPADEVAATPPGDVPPADTPPADVVAEEPPIVNREGEHIEPPAEETPAGPPATATAAGRAKLAAEGAEGAQEAADGPEAATAAPEAPETETGDGDGGQQPPADPPAPPAEEPQPESAKKGETRLYKLLYQSGPTTWEEADLAKVDDSLKQYVEKDDGELFLKSRNNDHARRIAWAIMGRPEQGVTVELVARTSWKPKRLSTAPPEPTRERLVIS
jgi:hypothetical protein